MRPKSEILGSKGEPTSTAEGAGPDATENDLSQAKTIVEASLAGPKRIFAITKTDGAQISKNRYDFEIDRAPMGLPKDLREILQKPGISALIEYKPTPRAYSFRKYC